ncbi:MAG: SDR family oxidoreductase [Ignavibacteriaceae bacterium]|nr:SDR family oxidoreductase [Ignavibacteriaceae bacterium]
MNKILITGAAGFLGGYLFRLALEKGYEVTGTYHTTPGHRELVKCDFTGRDEVISLVNRIKPDVIVHAGAISKVSDSIPYDHYHRSNTEAVRSLAEAASENKARLIYISTDLVYDGTSGFMRDEAYKIAPASSYAETKYKGEEETASVLSPGEYLILRASLMYGFGGVNFFENSVNNLLAGKPVNLFTDQYRTPLYGKTAAEIILYLAERNITGITMNMGGTERISRWEFMKRFAIKAGISEGLLIPVPMSSVPVPQVADVSMDISALKETGAVVSDIDESFSHIISQLRISGKL